MSGPVTAADAPPVPSDEDAAALACDLDVVDGRRAQVGAFGVVRVLPRRPRRTVGAWCFADHMGPAAVTGEHGLDIGPHPHIGLQTVTWLLQGEVLHRDSLGSEQVIRPAQLNLMTAGRGVSHAEEAVRTYRGELHGVQLWVAQPADTRDTDPSFEHHAVLPEEDVGHATATVLIGDFGSAVSSARRDTDHVGVDLRLRSGRTALPLEPTFEYALVVLEGALSIGERRLVPGRLGYLGLGRSEVTVDVRDPCSALLLGGVPFPEPVLMWWNYVARTRDEITGAHRDWVTGSERFGNVASPLPRIVPTAGPPWASTALGVRPPASG